MALRSMASVKISFGLVTVPVNIYTSAESAAKVSFNWLHKKCNNRLKQQYICSDDGEVVEKDDRVKGYQFQKGEYVVFTTEELKVLEAKGTQTVDIVEFVPFDQVSRVHMDKVYYLGPDKGGDKPYHLLRAALQKTKLSALARYNARGKQYLVLIRPMGDEGLVMEQLHYHDELKSFDDVPLGKRSVNKTELDMAVELVKRSSAKKFEPDKYEDEIRRKIMANIQKKIDGEDITRIEEPPQKKVVDLMTALKASLADGPVKSRSGKTLKKKTTGGKTKKTKGSKKKKSASVA